MIILGLCTLSMCILRYFVFSFHESPKNLVARGKYEDAVDVLEDLAKRNNVSIDITVNDLRSTLSFGNSTGMNSYSPLFRPDLRLTTILIILIWIFVAIGYQIFNGFIVEIIASNGHEPLTPAQTYTNYFIVSLCGLPGSLFGMYIIDSRLGRRGTMAIATLLTSVALYSTTLFTSPTGQLITTSSTSFIQNVMYGVIYSYSPEVFPTSVRGKAVGLASGLGRIAAAFAPMATGHLMSVDTKLPLYVSSSTILFTVFFMIMLPIETKGRSSL